VLRTPSSERLVRVPDRRPQCEKLAHPVFAYFHGLWGRRPQTPGICRFAPETWHGGRRRTAKATSPMSLDRGGARVASQQSGFPNAMNRIWGPDLSSAAAHGKRRGTTDARWEDRRQVASVFLEHGSALLLMFLARSGKSQGSGDSVPGGRSLPYLQVRKSRMSRKTPLARPPRACRLSGRAGPEKSLDVPKKSSKKTTA